MDDDAIRDLVRRLARPHHSGGDVIERSVIIAEGTDSAVIIAWIGAHAGAPESTLVATPRQGLHGPRLHETSGAEGRMPLRYVLPPGALA